MQQNKNKNCAFVSLQMNPILCPILLLDRQFLVTSWFIVHSRQTFLLFVMQVQYVGLVQEDRLPSP